MSTGLRRLNKLAAVAERAKLDPTYAHDRGFVTRELVLATLPHRSPRRDASGALPPEWSRTNGNYTLSIRPGYQTNPATGAREPVGYPFGTIPRLILLWMNTEVVRSRSRTLRLGRTLRDFMLSVGLSPATGGGRRSDATRLKDQMNRLFRSTVSFEYSTESVTSYSNLLIADRATIFWSPKHADQTTLWESEVVLSQRFYEALLSAPVPVVTEAIRALKNSPLALDLYVWASYMTFRATKQRRGYSVSWRKLSRQFGADYSDERNFQRAARKHLRRIGLVFPALQLRYCHGGIELRPGLPAVPPRR